MKTQQYFREVASVYAMGIDPDSEVLSPVKCAVDVWRFTNSSKFAKGESRLLEIAREKFEEHFEGFRVWDTNEGYEHDIAEKPDMRLNAIVKFYVYTVRTVMGQAVTDEIARGVVKW